LFFKPVHRRCWHPIYFHISGWPASHFHGHVSRSSDQRTHILDKIIGRKVAFKRQDCRRPLRFTCMMHGSAQEPIKKDDTVEKSLRLGNHLEI
jgi:hypothetical protein